MTSTELQVQAAPPVLPSQPTGGRPRTSLLTVVGMDGSGPSLAALEAAAQLIRGRDGHLEVVYVAHLSAFVGLSAPALVGTRESNDALARELDDSVRAVLDDREPRWHFQRRDGSIAEELVAAACELRRQHGPDAAVVIVVGASVHAVHQIAGSVGVALARGAGFPLLIVPTAPAPR